MACLEFLILRKPQSGCLEGRTALIQPVVNFLTASQAGVQGARPSLALLGWTAPDGIECARL